MKTLTIRGIDKYLAEMIKKLAQKNSISINKWALNQIKKAAGIGEKEKFKTYHDLDHLAGTWTEKDYNEFKKNTKHFEEIDQDLWQ